MADTKSTIIVDVDASGAQAGANAVNRAVDSMGAKAKQVSSDLSGIPNATEAAFAGAEKAAEATNRTVGVWASRIKSTIIDIKAAGDEATRYELKAIDKGIPRNVYGPYIEELRAAKAAQKALADEAAAAGGAIQRGLTPRLNEVGMSARATSAALRQVPAQFTDIIVSLQGGQNPMTVLLQQGGQLKDVFGGIVPAARALGGYIAGLVNPFTIAAAAGVALSVAFFKGQSELTNFQNAMTITGKQAQVTTSQFNEMAQSLAGLGGRAKASEVLTEIAESGKVAGDQMKNVAEVAMLMERATGQAVSKTVDQFARLADEPVKASIELNKQYNYLTAAVYSQIRALEEQGKKTEAVNLAERAYADAMRGRAATVVENVGLMERAWKGVAGVATTAWNAMLGVGRQQGLQERLASVTAEIEKARKPFNPSAFGDGNAESRANLQKNLQLQANLQEMVRLEKRGGEAAAEAGQIRQKSLDATVRFENLQEQYALKAVKREKEIAEARRDGLAAGKSQIEIEKVIAGIRDKYADTKKPRAPTGAAGVGETEVAGYRARIAQEAQYLKQLKERGVEAQKLTYFEEASIRLQEELRTSMTGATRSQKERALAVAQSGVAQEKEIASIERRNKLVKQDQENLAKQIEDADKLAASTAQRAIEQEAANSTYGRSKTAIEQLRLEQLRLTAAQSDASENFAPAYVAALNMQADAQERYVSALKAADYKDLQAKQIEYARTVEDLGKAYEDEALLAGLTGLEREKVLVARRIELDVTKQIAEINKSMLDDAQKEELRVMARATQQKQLQAEIQKATVDDWNKASDAINKSLTDAIMRGFESGKGFAENLRDTTINMFKTMVLRPVISAVVNPIGQVVSSTIGQAASGSNPGTGIIGSLLSSPITQSLSMGLKAGFSSLLGESGITGALSAGMASIGTATGTGIAAGLGTIAGALGPIALGIAAVSSLFSGKKDNRQGSQYQWDVGSGSRLMGGPNSGVDFQGQGAAQNAIVDNINAILLKVGSSNRLAMFASGFESSEKGKGFSYAGGQLTSGAQFGQGATGLGYMNNRGSKTPEQALKEFENELKQSILQALEAAGDTPNVLRKLIGGANIDALSGTALDDLIKAVDEQITAVERYREATASLPAPMANLASASFDAAVGLMKAAGGLDKLSAGVGAYWDNFFTSEEKRSAQIAAVNRAVAGTGLDANSATRAQFRALAQAQDINTEAGQRTFAALMSVAGAFAELTQEAEGEKYSLGFVKEARNDLIDAYEREVDAMKSAVEKFRDFAKDIRNFRDSLLTGGLSPLTPAQKYSEASSQFDRLMEATRSGTDEQRQEAYGKLQDAASGLLEASRAYNASGAGYVTDFAKVQEALSRASLEASATADVRQLQLDASRAQLDALGKIDKSVLTVAEAIHNLHRAQGQAGQVPAFEAGGTHKGGWAMVGEKGPELVKLPPARIYTATQTSSMGAQSDDAMLAALRSLENEVRTLRMQQSVQTNKLIETNYDANARNAAQIATAQSRNSWSRPAELV